jgi:hypothetical protein
LGFAFTVVHCPLFVIQTPTFVLVEIIRSNRDRYFHESTTVEEKRTIVMEIVGFMQESSRPFLKEIRSSGCDGARWIPLTKEATRQKVAHALQYRQRCSVQKQRKEGESSAVHVTPPLSKGTRTNRRRTQKRTTFESKRGTDDQVTTSVRVSTPATGIFSEMVESRGVYSHHFPAPTSASWNNDCAGSEVSVSEMDDSVSVNEWEDLITNLNDDDKLEKLPTDHKMDHNNDEMCEADEMLIELELSGDEFPFLEEDTASVSLVSSIEFEAV